MNDKANSTNDLRSYLLGSLAEDSQQRLEEELMTNDKTMDDLLVEEDELIDDFLWDNLSPDEKQQFLATFLCTTERQKKLRFARAFKKYVSDHAGSGAWWHRLSAGLLTPSPAIGYPIAAVLVLAVLGSAWLALRFQGRLDQVTGEKAQLVETQHDLQQQLSEERSRRDELVTDLTQEQRERQRLEREIATLAQDSPTGSVKTPAVVSFLLSPGLLRSLGDTERVLIPPETSLVQLQLDVGVDDYESYRVALHDAEGDEIWTQSKLTVETIPDKAVVAITLPATLLPHGDYSLRLSGITTGNDYELVARYYFRAIPQ